VVDRIIVLQIPVFSSSASKATDLRAAQGGSGSNRCSASVLVASWRIDESVSQPADLTGVAETEPAKVARQVAE
jgi:hypothetical protein